MAPPGASERGWGPASRDRSRAGASVPLCQALGDTQHAFDGVAHDYDRTNAANPILSAMRERALAAILAVAPAGAHVLDLGCGPGTDAETLARNGCRVTAVDWSAGMVAAARARAAAAGLDDLIAVRHLGIHELDEEALGHEPFDAAFSNFGPLNCVPRLDEAARRIARRLKPGGALVASVIGRVCPWEMALYFWRRDVGRALLRFARGPVPVPLDGRTVWTEYWTPSAFERVFAAAGFRRESLRTLGLFAPPPYLEGFAGRHPRLTRALHRADDAVGAWPGLRACGDHFLMTLRKKRRAT